MAWWRSAAWAALVGLAGCGVAPDEFVPQYAQSYCEYLLECGDQAQLTFDGITSVDDCLATEGPAVEAQAATCDYKHGPAKDCLDGLSLLTCPDDPADVDAQLPSACLEVFLNCAPTGAAGAVSQ